MPPRRAVHPLRRLRRAVWRQRRPACAAASAVLYLLLAIGVPLPLGRSIAAKDTSEPFPCMDSPCGCRNAEQCWRHCCCHTLIQRLAWAREQNVRPPEYVIAEAKAEGIDWQTAGADKSDGESGTACCCCCHKTPSVPSASPQQRPAQRTLVLIQALGCRGLDGNSTGVGVSLPSPAIVQWSFPALLSGQTICVDQTWQSLRAEPEAPPPRV